MQQTKEDVTHDSHRRIDGQHYYCILLGESAKEKEVIFVLSDECNASHAPISCN